MRLIHFASLVGSALGVVLLGATGMAALLSAGAAAEEMPTYNPPMLGAPETRRVGGGTRGLSRGAENDELQLVALTPVSTGLSAVDQPVLYWAISRAVSQPVEITVNNNDAKASLVETSVQVTAPGIYAFKLADSGKRLQAGVEYEWFVRVALDPSHPSSDVVASGTLIYQDAATLSAQLKQARADKVKLAALYAGAGYWYDAFATLSAEPGNEAAKAARSALLKQIGLERVEHFAK